MKSFGRGKEVHRRTINKHFKRNTKDARIYPLHPLVTKAHSLQNVNEKLLIDMIVGLLYIKFTNHPLSFLFDSRIHMLISNQHSMQNLSIPNKSILKIWDHMVNNTSQLDCKNLRQKLIHTPNQAYWSI